MNIKLFFLAFLFSTSLYSQTVAVGAGSYTLSLPVGATILPNNAAPGTSHYQRVDNVDRTGAMPKVVPGFSQPIATHEWWSSAIWSYEMPNSTYYPDWLISPYSFTMHPHPFIVAATRYGLNLSSEDNPVNSAYNYHNFRENHLSVGLDGMDIPANIGTKVKSYGDWSVTMQWDDGAGRVLEATSGHGFPYVYFNKSGGSDPTLRFQAGVPAPYATISNATVVARGVTILGKNYGIFCPPGTTFSATYTLNQMEGDMSYNNVPRDAYKIQLPAGQNYFSVALLPDNSQATLDYYAKFAFSFVTDTKVSWEYDECKSEVINTFAFTTQAQGSSTETKTLMAMYRHQWMHTSTTPTSYSYSNTARGVMKVFEGSSFTNTHTNHGFLHSMPDYGTYNKAAIATYVQQEVAKGKNYFFYADNASLAIYGAGVALQKVSDLAELANMVGDYTSRNTLLTWTKNYLQRWFTTGKAAAPNDDQFYYDANWQSLIGMPSAFESDRQLNDHHFGYGYFVKAAAVVAKFEPDNTWETQWGPMVEMLIKDVANWDRSNTQFPFLRTFDPYAGHSWASGHANFTAGNNQESSSEAINFASGVALWGTETDNKTLRDLGAFLYATEIEAARQYWFDEDNVSLPSGWGHDRVGIVWGWGADYQTWFGSATWPGVQAEYVHGISFLPISGSSLYLGLNPANAQANYNEIISYSGPLKTDFKDVIWCFQALFDASAAKTVFTANEASYIPQTGETKAHTMQWIGALDKLGTIDATTTADMPTYAVFNKDGCKNYVVYNPAGTFTKSKVTFSDGRCFLLPKEDTMYVFTKCPDVTTPDSTYITCPNNPVKLSAKDTTCANNYQWDRNGANIGGAINSTYMAALDGEYHVSYNISSCIIKTDTFTVQLKDTITTSNISKVCNAGGTAYTLSFDISGGDAASYTISVNGGAAGGPGTLTGSTFTSELIASGATYFFIVTDKNNCDRDTITGKKACNCSTDAGTMNTNLLTICGDTAFASATHNGDELLDLNDSLIFYLHSGNGSTLGTVYDTAKTASFKYNNLLSYGTTYYISAVAGNSDLSAGVNITDPCLSVAPGTPVVFNALPTAANAGTDTTLCGSSIVLSGNKALIGTGIWTLSSGGGTFSNITDSNATVTNLAAGINTFVWTIVNGSCPTSFSAVNINSLTAPGASNAGANQTLCNLTTATLAGNSPLLSESGTWAVESGSATIANPLSPTSAVNALIIGKNSFIWTISNGTCDTKDTVDIIVSSLPTSADAGKDQDICSTSATLEANAPIIGDGVWTMTSGSADIADTTSPTTTVSGLINGNNYTFLWTISNGTCPQDTQSINIHVKVLPRISLGEDSTLCAGDFVILNAGDTATATNRTYVWQDNSTFPQYKATESGTYSVKITSDDCPQIGDTITFDNNCPYTFYVPNAFTPNGDSKNDVFMPKANNIENFQMDIFDRWGENIYSGNDLYTGWNGKRDNIMKDAQVDVYVYKITFSVMGKNDKEIQKSLIGRVTLIR